MGRENAPLDQIDLAIDLRWKTDDFEGVCHLMFVGYVHGKDIDVSRPTAIERQSGHGRRLPTLSEQSAGRSIIKWTRLKTANQLSRNCPH
jgi:hypothetical protein